jgi:manganese transport protein
MGSFASPPWLQAIAWPVAIVIAVLNVWLLWQTFA